MDRHSRRKGEGEGEREIQQVASRAPTTGGDGNEKSVSANVASRRVERAQRVARHADSPARSLTQRLAHRSVAAVRRCSAHAARMQNHSTLTTADDLPCVACSAITDATRHPPIQPADSSPAAATVTPHQVTPPPSCTLARERDANLKSTRMKLMQLLQPLQP